MARPGLMRHKKFARLARLIGNEVLARGHLELLWEVAYENGDDLVGDAGDLEHLTKWGGAPGALAAALLEAGFVDQEGDQYRVHDLWDHAPDYVRKRRQRENERQEKGFSLSRNGLRRESVEAVFSTDKHSCALCGSEHRLEIDHIQPRAAGGSDARDNLRLLCMKCNRKKSAEDKKAARNGQQCPPNGAEGLEAAPNGRPRAPAPAPSHTQEAAAATRASAREGTQLGSEAARASHPPPAEPAVSEPEVQTKQEVPAVPGTAGPAGEPTESGSPTSSPTPAAVGHPAEAATPAPPTRSVLVLDTTELGEGAADLRAKLERRAEWKFLVAAHERRAEVRKALEVMVEALGVDRCEELCWSVLERRKRNGMQPPKALAFFVPMLEEAAKGGDPMPPEQPSPEFDQAQSLYDTEVEARWAPLLARFNPATREAYEADKARLLSAIRAKGLWVSAEKAELREAEGWLFTKYSRRAAGEA